MYIVRGIVLDVQGEVKVMVRVTVGQASQKKSKFESIIAYKLGSELFPHYSPSRPVPSLSNQLLKLARLLENFPREGQIRAEVVVSFYHKVHVGDVCSLLSERRPLNDKE